MRKIIKSKIYRVCHLTFSSISTYFVNGNTYFMSYWTDNWFYPSAERIWQKKIIFSDEAHFDLYGYIKKHKWARRGRYSQWQSLSGHVERIFVHKNWIGAYWQHLDSSERRYVPRSRSYTRCFAPCFWRSHYQPRSWCRLATSELRFDTVRLLFVGLLLNWTDRVGYCMASWGSHLNEIIFHY